MLTLSNILNSNLSELTFAERRELLTKKAEELGYTLSHIGDCWALYNNLDKVKFLGCAGDVVKELMRIHKEQNDGYYSKEQVS